MPLFRRRPKRVPEAEQMFGLVVPPRGRIIHDEKGNVIFDEIAVMEFAERMRGREIIEFDDDDDTTTTN